MGRWRTLRVVAYPLVLAFLGYQLWRVRHGLGANIRSVGWGNAIFAGLLVVVGGVPGFFGWRVLLAGLGTRLSLSDGAWVFFLAGSTKYLPGGVWPTLAHAALARPLGESPARLAAANLASMGVTAASGLAVGLLALPRWVAADPMWWLLLPVVVVAMATLAAPELFGRLLSVFQRVLRRGDQAVPLPTRRTLVAATGLKAASWLVGGLHMAVLAAALGVEPVAAVTVGIGGYAVSMVAGLLALVTPSGLGVREVALWLTFASLLTGPDLVTLLVLSRLLLTVGDVGTTAAVLSVLACARRPITGGGGRPEGASS